MICIIPARKGSKGLKNKNIKKLDGIPLIFHTIKIAQQSTEISKILISTDDEKIIKLCRNQKKVLVLSKRSKKLSTDKAKSIDVYLHSIKEYESLKNTKVNDFCAMLPTHPVRSQKEIDDAIRFFFKKKGKFLITVKEIPPINFNFAIKKNKIFPYKNIKMSVENRQKLVKNFSPNGSLYIFNHNELKKKKTFMTKNTIAYIQKKTPSFDIDTIKDFNFVKNYIEK